MDDGAGAWARKVEGARARVAADGAIPPVVREAILAHDFGMAGRGHRVPTAAQSVEPFGHGGPAHGRGPGGAHEGGDDGLEFDDLGMVVHFRQNAWRVIEDGERVGLVAGNPPDWEEGRHHRDVILWMPRWVLLEAAKPYRATLGFPYNRREGDADTDLHEVLLLSAEAICFDFRLRTGQGPGRPMPVVVSRACVLDTVRAMGD